MHKIKMGTKQKKESGFFSAYCNCIGSLYWNHGHVGSVYGTGKF